ncbi:hypothetical protein HMPREF6123_2407 [Oribacterium sinus F0268]|uniref:Uncharacterized protein n=1 Tax=Oribacterium sinus F0268 TaxID=585501 RepID=C2L0Y8_9FIRM|nr:hypothetical protein HMPREF6123_2407 [Oribacterium sinus F0268]
MYKKLYYDGFAALLSAAELLSFSSFAEELSSLFSAPDSVLCAAGSFTVSSTVYLSSFWLTH